MITIYLRNRAKTPNTAVIDAATFANSYNAFWNASAPTFENLIRWINLSGLERASFPVAVTTPPSRRPLIAEYAFSIFVEKKLDEISGAGIRSDAIIQAEALRNAESRLKFFKSEAVSLSPEFAPNELREISLLFTNLADFFKNAATRIVLRPKFFGCGLIDVSEGDVLFGDTIYEVKAVDRAFRSVDLRQTLTYAALNFSSRQYEIKSVGLFNPRRGQYFQMDLEAVSTEISGKPSGELFAEIVHAISSGEISR